MGGGVSKSNEFVLMCFQGALLYGLYCCPLRSKVEISQIFFLALPSPPLPIPQLPNDKESAIEWSLLFPLGPKCSPKLEKKCPGASPSQQTYLDLGGGGTACSIQNIRSGQRLDDDAIVCSCYGENHCLICL